MDDLGADRYHWKKPDQKGTAKAWVQGYFDFKE
jgi:hypothetical protein